MSRFLTAEQVKHYRDYGYLTISGFFTEAELSAATNAYEQVLRERPADVVCDSEDTHRRFRVRDMTPEEQAGSHKVNDLYLRDNDLRETVMSPALAGILRELMHDDPVVINTLSLKYGSQQADHLDTLYMTPLTPGHLAASWMALEDVRADAGPLRYYPESNHIDPFVFSDGGFHFRDEQMPRWAEYMADEVERKGLAETRFLAKRGDLFIWDAWLLHGGSEICTPGLTRQSLITHYFTATDCRTLGAQVLPTTGGHWMRRPPQSVPGETPQEAAANNWLPDPGVPQPLYDRMMTLQPEAPIF